jgi:sodium-dependent dicarboxylate transporter 2/3/5
MVLGVAYAATIGGLGTLVGSPTNAIAAGLMERTLGIDVTFLAWAAFGLPVVAVGIPAAAFLLNRLHAVPAARFDRAAVLDTIGAPGPFTPFERRLLPLLALLLFGWTVLPFLKAPLGIPGVEDAVVVIAVALAMFVLPQSRGGAPMLDRTDVPRAPWDVLLLFGGGLALADAITGTGLALWLGTAMGGIAAWPVWLAAGVIVAVLIVVTEFASNVATASGFIPVIAGIVAATGADPWLLAMPAAMAASWGFMMPAGTGPNAIAYASGHVTVAQMIRSGLLVNLLGVPLIVGVCFAVAALRSGV